MPSLLPHRASYRLLFIIAGIYNIAWGLFSSLYPQWLFQFAGMPLDNHPQIFACLAMVVGLYGLVYFEIARVPERGFALAAVGFIGKVLGPIGLAQLIFTHIWPIRTLILCITNDLIWLPFFALYLRAAWPLWRTEVWSVSNNSDKNS